MRPVRFLVATVLAIAWTSAADAAQITVDYSVMTTPGMGLNLGTNTATLGGLTAEGFSATVTGSAGTPDDYPLLSDLVAQNLFVRNESPADLGLGVCSTGETCPSGASGNGEFNELSNEGLQELIRLTLPAGSTWVSLSLSSLDTNSGGEIERGWLFGSNSADPSTATPLFSFAGTGDDSAANQTFDISTFTNTYLFLVPWDHSAGSGTNNDFLLSEVIYDNGKPVGDVPVPEPATLTLLGLGLTAGAMRLRKRKS